MCSYLKKRCVRESLDDVTMDEELWDVRILLIRTSYISVWLGIVMIGWSLEKIL